MDLRLRAPTLEDMRSVHEWRQRGDVRPGLRTGRMLTLEQQEAFYHDVLCDRMSAHRYWSVVDHALNLVAFVGLTDIDWEAGRGEISLLTNGSGGVGGAALRRVLIEAFERMRLRHVFGECYEHNPALGFWTKMLDDIGGGSVRIPGRKWWGGELHGALLFWFDRESWRRYQRG